MVIIIIIIIMQSGIQTHNLNITNPEQRSTLKGRPKFAASQAIDGDNDMCAKTKEHNNLQLHKLLMEIMIRVRKQRNTMTHGGKDRD